MAHVEDRWHRTARLPDGSTEKVRSSRYGTGKRWRARYQTPDGGHRARSFDTKALAERFLTEVEHAKVTGTYRDPDAGRITLRKYAGQWLAAQGFDAVTREGVERSLRLHVLPDDKLGGRLLAELAARPSLVQAWLASLKLAPGTVRNVYGYLNSIMIAAMTDGLVSRNPCKAATVKLPRAVRHRVVPWAPPLAAAVREAMPQRYRAMIDAGTGLGLRQSELFGLSVEEIEFMPGRVVHVRQQVKLVGGRPHFAPPKGGKERSVPLAGTDALVLSAHIASFARPVTLPWHEPGTRRHGKPHTATLLFTDERGQALRRNPFNVRVWHPARAAAGLADERVNGCHMLRHVYASTLVARLVDPRTVAEYLGHADGGALVLRTYSHLMPDAEDRARQAIEAARGGADVPTAYRKAEQ